MIMSSKNQILDSIKQHTGARYEMPDLNAVHGISYPDKIAQFILIMKQVGGEAVVVKDKENVNDLIMNRYPDAKKIGSVLPDITCANFNPDDIDNPAELDGTDVAIIRGRLGVAENGAVWIEQDIKQRALYFISENLVILLEHDKIVDNMQEAYKRITTGEYGFGTFISGPSKTADIEQALVMGAHGARGVTVLLV